MKKARVDRISDPKNKSLKKRHIFMKSLWQCSLVFLEIIAAVSFMVWLSDKYWPINESFGYVERGIMFYAVYQITVFVILNTLNDIKCDSYLALGSFYKKLDLYYQTKDIRIKEWLEKKLEYQLDSATFNNINVRKEYEKIKDLLVNEDPVHVQDKIIECEHIKEASSLQWRCSFILRLLK